MSCFASLTYSDHDGYYWRTSQQSFIEEQMTYSDHWPRSVCVTTIRTLDGWKVTASAQPTLARLTDVIGGSVLPTPNTLDHTGSGRMNTNANVKKWNGVNSLGGMAATGMWPTPTTRDYKDSGDWKKLAKYADKKRLGCSVAVAEKQSGQLTPEFPEYLMGFPIGWTDLKQLETPSFPRSLNTSDQK
tara:strand:- start:75 stop:635 length:561 start_codon:yes stop_codon:yes gene_type:complete